MKANDKHDNQPAARRARKTVPAVCAVAVLLGAAGFGAGCGGGSGTGAVTQVPGGGTGRFTRAVSGKATITYVALEGGFYGLVTDTGERLLPIQMSTEFRQNGLRVRYDGAADDNQVSFYQWGTLTRLTTIEKLPAGE